MTRHEWYLWAAVYFNPRKQRYFNMANLGITAVAIELLKTNGIPFIRHGDQLYFIYDFNPRVPMEYVFLDKVTCRKLCEFIVNITACKAVKVHKDDFWVFVGMFNRCNMEVKVVKRAKNLRLRFTGVYTEEVLT